MAPDQVSPQVGRRGTARGDGAPIREWRVLRMGPGRYDSPMPDSSDHRGRPAPDPGAPPPNAFRPLPGNVDRNSPAASGAEPFTGAPTPTAESFAHRVTVGVVGPLLWARILIELPALVRDVRRAPSTVVPLVLAQSSLVVGPAIASTLPNPNAFRRAAVAASALSWPVTAATSIAAAKGVEFPARLSGYVSGITSAMASVSTPHWSAALNAVAQSAYMGVAKHRATRDRGAAALFSTTLMPAAVTVPYVFLAQAVALRAREHDAIARSTAASEVAAARLGAANAEAARFNALLHDQVLAVLKAVKNNAPAADVRHTTRVALRLTERADQNARIFPSARAEEGMAPGALDAALRTVILAVTPDCRIRSSAEGPPVPADVAAAMQSALRQVARNSARHAGDGVSRTCDISIRHDGIDLRYADDGRGFDPAEIPHDRLGVRTSIRDRLLSLDGATVRVESRPGAGTCVIFEWTPEPTETIPLTLADVVVRRASPSVLVGAAITAQMLLEPSTARHPLAAAVGWALGMGAFHLQRDTPEGRPPIPRTAAILGLATAGSLIPSLAGVRPANATLPAWHEYSFAVALSLLGARGRAVPAAAVSFLFLAGRFVRGRRRRVEVEASTHVPAIVLSGAIARWALRTVNRRIDQARTSERRLLDMVGHRHAENRVREANRRWLDDVAGDFLRRIRHLPDEKFTDADREMAGLLDALIRDSLRSPRLDRPDVTALAWQLRAHGLTVLLVDDRGDRGTVAEAPGLLDDVAAAFAEVAAHVRSEGIRDGRITVRLLPAGRSDFATIVLSPETAEPRRVRIPA